jgi:acyl-CoA synthetase (NDP forming)
MTSARSLAPLLKPRSVAIVGVSPKARYGVAMMRNNVQMGFTGPIYPINPNYPEIEGRTCYPSLSALPEVPDVAVLVVPGRGVLGVIEEAGKLGVPAAIVVAQGFAEENTDEGRRRQGELTALADRYNMAIAGPNCLGISSYGYNFGNSYSDLPKITPGGISILSQSGGLMNALASVGAERSAGLNYLVSFGNQAVVTVADYIDYMADDPKTRVIACIMEGVRDGRRFREAVERAARKKPLVIQKLGRSESGKRATLAHTGTLAGDDRAYVAFFRQNGVALSESLDQLMETAMLFDLAPLPAGNRAGMITVSGGTTGLIADVGEAAGLKFNTFSDATNAKLQKALKFERPLGNPIDTTSWPALTDEGHLDGCLDALLADDDVDLIGAVFRVAAGPVHGKLLTNLAERARGATKPVVCISTVSYSVQAMRKVAPQIADLPMLEDIDRGQKALRKLVDYGVFRKKAAATPSAALPALDVGILPQRTTLTEFESKKLLAKAGLPVTRETLATSAAEAAKAAAKIGFPVALKIQSPDVPHKSDAGGVVLRVGSESEAQVAYERIIASVGAAHPKAEIDGVLVQEMVAGGTEMILGMNRGELGPLVVLGLGGIFVEVMGDVALRFPPLGAADVREMLAEIKGAKLLQGYRGQPLGDVDALVEAVVAFGRFVAATDGRFSAIDVNPLIVRPKGQGVVVADALMVVI